MQLKPVGYVRSPLRERKNAPRQGWEGAPDAVIEIEPEFLDSLQGLKLGDDIWILTWFHESHREVQKVRPRDDPKNPITGVFATRSPDRPNPIGLHRSVILSIDGLRIEVQGLEAIDGTPIVDIKPVLEGKSCH